MGEPAKKLISQPNSETESPKERGDLQALRKQVVRYVVDEQYDRAVKELRSFLDKEFDYPEYRKKIEPFIKHSIDLVNAIKAKRRFPGMKSLTMAKQQELKEKYMQHFEELQATLDRIERVHGRLYVADIRSTVIVIKALVNACFVIALAAFVVEMVRGQFGNAVTVADDWLISTVEFISDFF